MIRNNGAQEILEKSVILADKLFMLASGASEEDSVLCHMLAEAGLLLAINLSDAAVGIRLRNRTDSLERALKAAARGELFLEMLKAKGAIREMLWASLKSEMRSMVRMAKKELGGLTIRREFHPF
jgi:hypothetical protein